MASKFTFSIAVAVAVLVGPLCLPSAQADSHKSTSSRGKRSTRPAAHAAGKGHAGQKAAQKTPPPAPPEITPQLPTPPPAVAERKGGDEAKPAGKTPGMKEEDRDLKRGERVEFDGRLIEGQTAAAGAIYLFERLPSELRSMVAERKGYRREELETLYPGGVVPGERRAAGLTAPAPDRTQGR